MVGIQEHKEKMMIVKKQIDTARGYRKKDLIRHYNKLKNELLYAEMQLKGKGK